jgi:glycyl-tRNA synthetase beta chain
LLEGSNPAHPGESRDPSRGQDWIPAFAGMSGQRAHRVHLQSIFNRAAEALIGGPAARLGSPFTDVARANALLNLRTSPTLIEFFHDRLKVYLRDKGHRHDRIDAVLARADGALEDDLVLIVMKLEALEAFLKTDDGANLAAGYKRAANILKAEEKRGALAGADSLKENLLQQTEEKSLFEHLVVMESEAKKLVQEEKFDIAMAFLSTLRAPIDAFFDKVTVNADGTALRANRLALLQRFTAATASVAELSKLEG